MQVKVSVFPRSSPRQTVRCSLPTALTLGGPAQPHPKNFTVPGLWLYILATTHPVSTGAS